MDDDADLTLPVWAGVLPLASRPGTPVPDGEQRNVPTYFAQWEGGR
jgi:hypothetical protein